MVEELNMLSKYSALKWFYVGEAGEMSESPNDA